LPLPQGGKAWPEDEPEARRPCHRIIFLGYLRLRDREEDKLCTQTIVPFSNLERGLFFNFSDGGEYLKNTKDTKIFKGDKV